MRNGGGACIATESPAVSSPQSTTHIYEVNFATLGGISIPTITITGVRLVSHHQQRS